MKPIATPEQFNQLAGEVQAPPLNYPRYMDSELCRQQRIADDRQRKADRYQKRQRIKDRVITVAWGVCLVGFGVALIVWG